MKDKIFGTDAKKPPYKVVGNYEISIVKENWHQYLSGNGYDKYFRYYKCEGEPSNIWYRRETKEEWKDKITKDIQHLPIKQLEEKLYESSKM